MARKLLNKKGFTMIELMVVVAIIGILAAIGLPQFNKFQSKARQTEAKSALAALFTSEESFRQEWNGYTVDLRNIGFGVTGSRLRYVTGFQSTVACGNYATVASNGGPTESTAATNTWSDGTNVNVGTNTASWITAITKPTAAGLTSCSDIAFKATAYGNPNSNTADPGATVGDTWTINEKKLLTMVQSYIQ